MGLTMAELFKGKTGLLPPTILKKKIKEVIKVVSDLFIV
jgi:hypothetical protein